MSLLEENTAQAPVPSVAGGFQGYVDGVITVLSMEMRQRLRSRGWYIMLAIWFVVIGLVTALTWWSWLAQRNAMQQWQSEDVLNQPGPLIFEIVLAFVLLFGLLVAPAFSANAVNGDRSAGTLAILQVTLLRPGQILWGKFLASWIVGLGFLIASVPFLIFAIIQGGLGAAHILVALLMLTLEIGVVCAIGVGISALANRPLFSIVVTYLVVAVLVFGTLISFGLGAMVSQGTVQANQVYYKYSGPFPDEEIPFVDPEEDPLAPKPGEITDQNAEMACYGPLESMPVTRTERVAWMLSMNPFVVVADSIPYPKRVPNVDWPEGIFEIISQGARFAQAGPDATYTCANGKIGQQGYIEQKTPLWPLGLGLQLLVTAGIVLLARRALHTPAGKLPTGTRIA